jgi:DNA-binding winged helix-turn-helix (wHTH) protein
LTFDNARGMRARFDRFTFDSEQRILFDGDEPVRIGPKAFQLLEILIAHAPRALNKRELYEQIWPDTFVNEASLAGLVNELRAVLGESAREPRFIRTVHGFGYSFSTRPCTAVVVFRGQEFPLRDGVNVLGRDPSADIQIDDVTVSRRHASITVQDDATLEDLDSKNGTFIDGVRVSEPTPLGDSRTFVLGDAAVTFRKSPTAGSTVTVHRG